MPAVAFADDLAGGDVEGGKQRRRAVISLLEQPTPILYSSTPDHGRGDIVETAFPD